MSDFPLIDAFSQQPEPTISPMGAYLRDENRSWKDKEARRKSELKIALEDWKQGKHNLHAFIDVLNTTLAPHNHMFSNLAGWAKNPKTFADRVENEDGQKSAADIETERKKILEEILHHNLNEVAQWIVYNEKAGIESRIDRWLSSLDQESLGSIDVITEIVNAATIETEGSNDRGAKSLKNSLSRLKDNEDQDRNVHPNDLCQDEDIFEILCNYKDNKSRPEIATEDEYQTLDEIELRRSMELQKILQSWKDGKHPYLVLIDTLNVITSFFDNPTYSLIYSARQAVKSINDARKEQLNDEESEVQKERALYSGLVHRDNVRRVAKGIMRDMREEIAAYKGPDNNPEFAIQIDAYIKNIQTGQGNSINFIQGMVEAMFNPVDDEHYLEPAPGYYGENEYEEWFKRDVGHEKERYVDDAPILTKIRATLKQVQQEEDAKFESSKPMGKLETQSEEDTRGKLGNIFKLRARRQRRGFEPLPKLTNEIHIHVSGSGMIKPLPRDEYDEAHAEELYGTTTARISTYTVSFVPKDPDRVRELAGYVSWALKRIARTDPDFDVPFDTQSEPYRRPTVALDWSEFSKIASIQSLYVEITQDGYVRPFTKLDLDDLWLLYYLLEDIIEPSEQIAQAMNAARYNEERGVLLTRSGSFENFDEYSNTNLSPEKQMGNLERDTPDNYVPLMIEDTLRLYAIGDINEEQLLQRVLVLSDHTLSGRMADPYGILPTFNLLAAQNKEGRDIITYNDALTERARDIMMIMTNTHDQDRPLFAALIAAAAKISKPLREKLREKAYLEHKISYDHWSKRTDREKTGPSLHQQVRQNEKEMQEIGLIDENGEPKENPITGEEQERRSRSLAHQANIVLRDSEVGATTDRTWRGTDYVSRSKNSLWVRKALPKDLEPFLKEQRPDMNEALLAITQEHK